MAASYFDRVRAATGTRFWVNNPTDSEVDLALGHGAAGCTTNPAYGGNLVKRSPAELLPIVRDAVRREDDDRAAAEAVQRILVAQIAEHFLQLHERSDGREGFVSIQGSPENDADSALILAEARAGRQIGPNVAPKIPATEPGLRAMETLVAEGSPVIVTEVFSLAQLAVTCERWLAVTRRSGRRPPFFISPITGILGDHLRKVAARDGIDVPAPSLELAGVLLSRRCYRLVRDREYPAVLLFGGARSTIDFTGLVGGGMAATINWSTAAHLLETDPAVVSTIDDPIDQAVEEDLLQAFTDVRQALAEDGLSVQEFEDFGPVRHFRDNFMAGWQSVLAMIASVRGEVGAASR